MPFDDDASLGSIGLDVDPSKALKAMALFQRKTKGTFKSISKVVNDLGRVNQKVLQKSVEQASEFLDTIDETNLSLHEEVKELGDLGDAIEVATGEQVALKKAGEETSAEYKELTKKVKEFSKQAEIAGGKIAKKLLPVAHLKKKRKELFEGLEKGGKEVSEVMSAFLGKDLKGTIEKITRGSGKAMGALLPKAHGGLMALAGKGRAAGAGLAEKGATRGGLAGGAMKASGAALKGLSSLPRVLGKLAGGLASLGPILGGISSVMMVIVQLFIDAEAKAKGFQKELLQSASTAEFLAASGGDANAAFSDLEDTMRQVRDAAFSYNNLNWGITSEEHKQVINVLTQEGVSLNRIRQEADQAQETVGDFASELTHVSVAYSRSFGVPLQEINQLQSEMMTEMGASLQDVRLSFGQMTRAATDSGIASNKFFAMIRGVSQDLSLYNMRLEDTVKTLQLLGKVMSPRNAQKFLQTATQGLKQMGRTERLRLTLLAGTGETKNIVNRDIKDKAEILGKKVKMSAKDVMSVLQTKGVKGLEDKISGLPDEAQGAVREMGAQIQLQMTRVGKGAFGISGAAADVGPAATLQLMQKAVGKFAGTDKLAKAVGSIGAEMMAENLGISQEQLDGMAKFEMAIDSQREVLKRQLKEGDEDTIKRLAEAGMDTAEDIDKAGYDQIYKAMDENTKKQADDATKIESLAQKQARLTQSMVDKLGTLVDFMQNSIYNVIADILDLLPWGKSERAERKKVQEAARKTGSAELQRAAKQGDLPAALMETGVVKRLNTAMDDLVKVNQQISATKGKIAEQETTKQIMPWTKVQEQQLQALYKQTDVLSASKGSLENVAKSVAENMSPEALMEAMEQAGVDKGTIDELIAPLTGVAGGLGGSAGGRRLKKGLTGADVFKEMSKVLSPEELAKTIEKAPVWTTKGPAAEKITALGAADKALADAGFGAETAKATVDTAKSAETTATRTLPLVKKESVYVRYSKQGLKLYMDALEKTLLSALREALFEYYLYSQLDPEDLVKYMSEEGLDVEGMARKVGEGGPLGFSAAGTTGLTPVKKNATGGIVESVAGGLATVAGEGLASVAPGERIVPAGAGATGSVIVNVNGIGGNDLVRLIRASVIDTVAAYKSRERYS